MNLYLDIDGVLLTNEGKEANRLFEFLDYATRKFDCYWLTTHCKGDTTPALEHLKGKVSQESFVLIKKVRQTNWGTWKTEAIDFKKDFLWLDDFVFENEMAVLEENNATQKIIKIDLRKNPDQLLDSIRTQSP